MATLQQSQPLHCWSAKVCIESTRLYQKSRSGPLLVATKTLSIDRIDHENSLLRATSVAVNFKDPVQSGLFGFTLDLCSYAYIQNMKAATFDNNLDVAVHLKDDHSLITEV